MLSIGEIAHSTGVSRRMLRHCESEGLLARQADALRQRVQPDESSAGELVLLYDGSRDDRITVSAGSAVSASAPEATGIITAPAAPDGVSVTFDAHPENIADAWVLIGTELERQNLTAVGIFRQIHDEEGGITLHAPVRTLR